MEKRQTNKTKKENKSIKTYLRDFLLFLDKKLLKTIKILLVIAILIIALTLTTYISNAMKDTCVGLCRDEGVTLISEYVSKLKVLIVTAVAGIVPYIFAPVIGFIGYNLSIVSEIAYIIKGMGYVKGILLVIIPTILNVVTISLITALGIYICKTVMVGYRISSVNNMNFLNFRIKLYEGIGNEEKQKKLTEKKEAKLKKLEAKHEKLNYLQIVNVLAVSAVLQFVSTLIQEIFI